MKRFSKKERRKIYLKAAELLETSFSNPYLEIKTYGGKERVKNLCGLQILGELSKLSDYGYYGSEEQMKELFPEFFLFNPYPIDKGLSWFNGHKQRVLALLFAAEICK